MRSDKNQAMSGMSSKQKATVTVFFAILIFLIWQVYGLLHTSGSTSTTTNNRPIAIKGGEPGSVMQHYDVPQTSHLVNNKEDKQEEDQLSQIQHEIEAKYLNAVNELQILKISREIAETNQAIAAAKLATVKAEKNIVDLLNKPVEEVPPETYSKSLEHHTANGIPIGQQPPHPNGPPTVSQPQQQSEAKYSVVSVTQLHDKWSAVLGLQGNLYNVSVGDILPPDQSKVISIDKDSVVLEKDGVKHKISLVSII